VDRAGSQNIRSKNNFFIDPFAAPPFRQIQILFNSCTCTKIRKSDRCDPAFIYLSLFDGIVKRRFSKYSGVIAKVTIKTVLLRSIIATAVASAAPTLVTGVPGNSVLAMPTGPAPALGGTFINFDDLTPGSSVSPNAYAGQGVSSISSPGGLTAIPFSTQSSPNELFDGSPNGTANITIDLATGASSIGIGIADSDPFSVTLQALAANGSALGSPFTVTIPASGVNSGNGYYAIEDTTTDIFGLKILQSSGSVSNSGLAIDDLQFTSTAPEPTTYALFGAGTVLLALLGRRKRA
jgi:hypothetical protein